jgi:hypothetical protein
VGLGQYGTGMEKPGRPRCLRVRHRTSALLVALLWTAAPMLAALHANAEVHRYCAEHGALEDGSTGADTAGVDGGATASDAGTSAPHDDCAFARYCRFGQLLTLFALPATGELPVSTMIVPRPVMAPPAALAIIRLAPKTSPPV